MGQKKVAVDVLRLKSVQDTLARHGVLLVFAIAPDKANFYSEKHPDDFNRLPRTESNYTAYARQMKANGVNLLDFAAVFQRWKDTASYPLFPRGGIHWSGYGITLAADTLVRYLEHKGDFDLPDVRVTGRTITDKPRYTDNDISQTLNLFREPAAFTMAYPTIEFMKPTATQTKPRLLVVGDSFVWSFISFYPYIPELFSSQSQFWYYNQQVQWGARPDMAAGNWVWQLDHRAELLNSKVILVLFTQHNLVHFDKGFTNKAFDFLCKYSSDDERQIQEIATSLRQKPGFQDSLWQWSARMNRPEEYLMHDSAAFEYDARRAK